MKTKMLSLTTKLLLSLIFFTLHHNGNAQDKTFFVPDPLTARWSYSETDGDGNQVATVFYSVEKMSGDAINGKVKLLVLVAQLQVNGILSLMKMEFLIHYK